MASVDSPRQDARLRPTSHTQTQPPAPRTRPVAYCVSHWRPVTEAQANRAAAVRLECS